MIFVQKQPCQLSDDAVTESMFRNAAILLASVDLQIANETIQRVCTHPHFNSPFHGFHWKVLFCASLTFESNHCFVNRKVLTRSIFFEELSVDSFEEWTNLEKLIVITVCTWSGIFIIVNVQILSQFVESISGHYSLHIRNAKGFIFGPIQISVREFFDPKQCLGQSKPSFLPRLFLATLGLVYGHSIALHTN